MLNRFWIVAAMAAVFALCSVSGAQEKKSASRNAQMAGKGFSVKSAGAILEKSRAIDVGAPSATDTAKDIESLTKILQGLGYKTRTLGEGSDVLRVVNVRGLDMAYYMIENNAAVVFNSATLKLKEPSQISGEHMIALLWTQSLIPGRTWDTNEGVIFGIFALESRLANKGAIDLRVNAMVDMWIDAEKLHDHIVAPRN